MLRVSADFNSLSPDGSQVPVYESASEESQKFHIGRRIIVYEPEDFEVEAVLIKVRLENGREVWRAIIDWPTKHNISSL